MKKLLFAYFAFFAADAHAVDKLSQAREAVKNGDCRGAVVIYSELAAATPEARLAAEYAGALSCAGLHEMALATADRAFLMDSTDPEVLAAATKALAAAGKATRGESALGPLDDELLAGEHLLSQGRAPSAAWRFQRLTLKYPKESLAWSGYAIALEQLGAYKEAAGAVAKELELGTGEDREAVAAHKAELEQRPPLQPAPRKKPNELLAGKYLAFLGGSFTHTEFDSIFNLNARLGKFLTDRINVAADAGLTSGYDDGDYNGLSLGLSSRYFQPLGGGLPLSASAGARLQMAPGPSDTVSFILSPGLSWFTTGGSVDLNLDIALSGPLKDTKTLSLGYTVYFGTAR